MMDDADRLELLEMLDSAVSSGDARTATRIKALIGGSVQKHEPMGAVGRFAYGASEPITGLAQLAYNSLPEFVQKAGDSVDRFLYENTSGILGKQVPFNDAIAQQENWYKQRQPEGFDAARIGGNILTGVLATRGMGAPATLSKAVGQGAVVGGGLSAVAPVTNGDYWNEKASQVATGAGFGAAMGPVGYGIGKVIQPKGNIDAKMMSDAGVSPTIGSTVGGWVGRLEEMAQSIPIFGDAVRTARAGARDRFNNVVLNDVVKPVGGKVGGIGTDGIAEVQAISNQAYKAAENMIKGFRLDGTAIKEISDLIKASRSLKPSEAKRFNNFINNEFKTRFRGGGATTNGFKRLDAEIGKAQSGNQGSELGGAFKELGEILKRNAERANPAYRDALDRADEVFAKRVIVEHAANNASGNSGVFTPKQLLQATKATDKTSRRNASAGGKRPFQDFAQAASRTIGDNYPESGTAGRAMTGGLLGGGVMMDPLTTALTAGALWAGGRSLYNPVAQKILSSAATIRPDSAKGIADAISKSTPLLVPSLLQMD